MKVENMSRTMNSFAGMGFPAWVGAFIGLLEVVGGAALIFGIFTRVFAVAFGIEMLEAVHLSLAHAGMSAAMGMATSWQATLGGTEMFLAIASFALALMGSGRYSLFKAECHNCGGMMCKPGENCPGPVNP
jgi:putative oxidoreductase